MGSSRGKKGDDKGAPWYIADSVKESLQQRMTGRSALATTWIKPAFSAKRMTPSHSDMIPTSGKAIFMTAVSAMLNALSVISLRVPAGALVRLW